MYVDRNIINILSNFLFYHRDYSQALLDKHKSSIEQLIHRDRNHPSVVMWSIANEPRTAQLQSDSYFGY